ncbi:MAG: GGDEF domain-containing protein [Endomicrobiaceae bacterium]|nr:GGDEF domain-containing protein [Endomicrobiaceae bacterium]
MKRFLIILLVVLLSLLAISYIFYLGIEHRKSIKNNFQMQLDLTLHEMTTQSATTLENEIKGKLNILTEMADNIAPDMTKNNISTVLQRLKKTVDRHGFKKIAIAGQNGMSYSTDNAVVDVLDREYFKRGMIGLTTVTELLTDKYDGNEINVFSVPIHFKEKTIGILFAIYSSAELQKFLEVSIFDKTSSSYVVDVNGNIIINSPRSSDQNVKNLFEDIITINENTKGNILEMKKNMNLGKAGYIKFNHEKNQYVYYYPINMNNWYLLIIVPIETMDAMMDDVLEKGNILFLKILGLVVFLFLLILLIQLKRKKELARIAYVDAVTGGDTYAKFCINVRKILDDSPENLAILNINIDGFKFFNNIFGYDEGNKVIRFIWKTLNDIKQTKELHAHHYADNFYALFYFTDKKQLFERLLVFYKKLQNYAISDTKKYMLAPHIGIYEIKNPDIDINNMINYSNLARKSIKERKDIFYAFFDDNFEHKQLQDSIIESQMRDALEQEEFVIYLQPKYNTLEQKIVGAEALVRWKKEDGTTIVPMNFIPLFEKNRFITELDKYVYTTVCKKQKMWLGMGLNPVPVSINLSRLNFYNPNFVKIFKEILDDIGLAPQYIQLEITESAILENIELLNKTIEQLYKLGFKILIDDFGVGYSSMMLLRDTRIHALKLDKSFIDSIGDMRTDKIVYHTINLAHSLKIEVIAEGVETESQYKFLKAVNCDSIQGYYFSKPITEFVFEKILMNR